MSAETSTSVNDLRRAFSPGMTAGQLAVWVFSAACGLGVWALGFLAVGAVHRVVGDRAAAAMWLAWTVLALAVPGVGVLRPGGARGPTILRAMPAALILQLVVGALVCSWGGEASPPSSGDDVLGALLMLWCLGSPLVAAILAWAAFSGRSAVRSGVLVGALALTVLGVAGLTATASGNAAWFVVAGVLALAGVAVAAHAGVRRRRFTADAWLEADAADGVLRAGDEAWPLPAAYATYRGVVSVPRGALPPQSPGRGARPPDPDALFACARAQVPWILRDLLDAKLALGLFLAASGFAACVVGGF